ncbi:MAG: ABC-2 family transporter protein [Oscillospiraceae bacterium]|nr:ABC-2 family transporter protein [Oscillospiraceae bacterium]
MKQLRKYFVIMRVSFTNTLTYRGAIFAKFIFYTLFIYIFMSLWRAIYQEGSVHGYDYVQIVWYLIMTEFVGFASGADIYRTMNEEIKTGAIAYQLNRPTHYVAYQYANALGQSIVNILSFGVLAIVLGYVFVGPLETFSMHTVVPLIISILLGITLNFFICMLIGLTAFYVEDNYAFFLIYQKATFMLGMFLPLEFLPGWLQKISQNLPFSYVHWAPARILVDYSPEIGLRLISFQLIWTIAAVILTLLCYSTGVKRLVVNGG